MYKELNSKIYVDIYMYLYIARGDILENVKSIAKQTKGVSALYYQY